MAGNEQNFKSTMPSPKQTLEERIEELIRKQGFAIQHVFGDWRPDIPPFSYTVGLSRQEHPELIVFGLPAEVAHGVLHAAVSRMKEEGGRFEDGAIVDRIATIPLKARHLSEDLFGHFSLAAVRQSEKHETSLEVIQIVLPDRNGCFPGDPGCSESFARDQTIERLVEDYTEYERRLAEHQRRH